MEANELVIADHGHSDCVIVVAADAIPSERHAAEELQTFLREITGVELPIRADSEAPCPHEIVLGHNARARALGVDVEPGGLGAEGFVIRTVGENLVIAGGRPRGTLYGVYEFLERFAGCRWFTSKVSRIPRAERLAVPDTNIRKKPALEYREVFFTDAFDGDWAARNRMNGNHHKLGMKHGGGMSYYGFVHTFNSLVPVMDHFESHPEYFSMVDGQRLSENTQLCLTNEDVFEIALGRVRQWIAENPDANIISVSQNDCYNPCQCPDCRAVDEEEGSHSGTLLRFVNRIAVEIAKEYPGVLIDTLAYQYTRKPPRHVAPAENVIVRLCSIECCFAHPLASCSEISYPFTNRVPPGVTFAGDIAGWSKICKRLYVWDYVTNFSNYIMPFPNFRVLQPNIKFLMANNVRGIFEQGSYSAGGCGEFAELRAYVLARILWDPDTDADGAVDEFLEAYYGGAARHIRRYIDLLHDGVAAGGFHVGIYDPPQSPWLDGLAERALPMLDDAEKAARGADEICRVRVARMPLEYVRISRLPSGSPGRAEAIEAFFKELEDFGVTEIREFEPLAKGRERMLLET